MVDYVFFLQGLGTLSSALVDSCNIIHYTNTQLRSLILPFKKVKINALLNKKWNQNFIVTSVVW